MKAYWRAVWTMAGKDVLLERRSLETLISTGAFALLLVVMFYFAFDIQGGEEGRFFPGALWIALLFAGTLGMGRTAGLDEIEGRGRGPALAPVDRSALFLGKFLFHVGLLTVVEVVVVPLFIAAFSLGGVGLPGLFVLGIFLGTWGFAAMGTLLAGATIGVRGAGLVLPIILFPLLVPVALGGVAIVEAAVAGATQPDTGTWIRLLLVFDLLFTAIPALFYEYILEV